MLMPTYPVPATAMFKNSRWLFDDVGEAVEFVLDVLEAGDFSDGFVKGESTGVVGVELGEGDALDIAVLEVFVVVEVAVVGRHTVEVAHVLCLGTLLVGEQGFVHLLAMTDADDLDVLFVPAEEFAHGFGLRLDGAGWRLLD